MAGDWIKIEHGLLNKPEVMLLADALDISHFEAVGHLIAFRLWVDMNMSPSCPQVRGTKKGLDRVAGRDGFADALISVGWLDIESDKISIPGYEVHLSKSAKERAKGQKKKAAQRSKVSLAMSPTKGDENGTEGGTREEKRREEYLSLSLPADDPNRLIGKDVIVPDYMREWFIRWLDWRWQDSGKKPPATLQQTWIMELHSRGQEKAIADLQFSISKQAKNLLKVENDFDKIKTAQVATKQFGRETNADKARKLLEDLKNGSQ